MILTKKNAQNIDAHVYQECHNKFCNLPGEFWRDLLVVLRSVGRLSSCFSKPEQYDSYFSMKNNFCFIQYATKTYTLLYSIKVEKDHLPFLEQISGSFSDI